MKHLIQVCDQLIDILFGSLRGGLQRDRDGEALTGAVVGRGNGFTILRMMSSTFHSSSSTTLMIPPSGAVGSLLGQRTIPETPPVANSQARRLNIAKFQLEPAPRHQSDGSRERTAPDVIKANAKYLRRYHADDPNLRGPGMGDVAFGPSSTHCKQSTFRTGFQWNHLTILLKARRSHAKASAI